MTKRTKLITGLAAAIAIIAIILAILPSPEKEPPLKIEKPARIAKITKPGPEKAKPAEIEQPVAPADITTNPPAAKKAEEGGTISGIVVDMAGDPIENATLKIIGYQPINHADQMFKFGNPNDGTDSTGAFKITGLQNEGRYDIEVTAKAYGKAIERKVPVGSSDVLIKLPREVTLSGTVFSETSGEALAGISVRLAYPREPRGGSYIESHTTSDTAGRYFFDGLGPSDSYLIEASGNSLISDPVYLELEEAQQKEGFDLTVYPTLSLAGKVVLTGTTTPVADVKLNLKVGMFNTLGLKYGASANTTSDSEGLFTFSGLRAGDFRLRTDPGSKYRMELSAQGPEEPLNVTLKKNTVPEQLLVEVGVSRTILGTITDDGGQPLRNVTVRTSRIAQPSFRMNWTGHGRSDAEGKYRVTGLDPEATEFKVHFEHQKYADIITSVEFEEDEPEQVLDMELEQGLSLSGYVTDSDSEPVKGTKISASYRKRSDNVHFTKYAASDTEGHFEVGGIAKGKWTLKAEKSGYAPAQLRGLVVEDEDLTGIELVLARGRSISGTILLGDEPITNQQVRFRLRSGLRPITRKESTDEEGRFTISDLEQGTYTINASIRRMKEIPEGANLRREVENVATGTEDLVIRFGWFGSISGVVKDAATFEPITNFEVAYQADNDRRYFRNKEQVTGAEDGSFTIENIQADTYNLEVKAVGYSPKIIENIEVLSGQTTDGIEVLLGVGSQITGRVILANSGGPVQNARIHIDGQDRNRTQVSTDREGMFTITSVASGKTYTLEVRHSDYPSKKVESVETFEGETTYLDDIALSVGGIIEGRVTDEQGNAIEGAHLSTMFSGFDSKQGETDQDGHYTITGVALGEVTVVCNLMEEDFAGSSILTKTANTIEGVPVTLDFVFGGGYTISGTVTDNGNPITQAFAMLYAVSDGQTAQSIGMARLEDSNDFQIEKIKPGQYLLTIMGIDESKAPYRGPSFTYQHKQIIEVGHQNLTLDIKTYNSTVSGRVVDRQGNPVKTQLVLFEPLDIDFNYGDDNRLWQLKYLFAFIDKEGKFSLGRITPGRYRVGTNASQFKADFQPLQEINVIKGTDIKELVITVPDKEDE